VLKTRLVDFRTSRGPNACGLCQSDLPGCAAIVNAAEQKLIFAKEAGDTGFWGSWVRMAFNVSRDDPYVTTRREVARLERMTVCNRAVRIQNEFFEYLDFGIGLQPSSRCNTPQNCQFLECYERGLFPTFSDLKPGNKLRVALTDSTDAGKRVLFQGTDTNDAVIYSLDGIVQITGMMLTMESPFVDAPMVLNSLDGLQKDLTNGQVKFYEVNPDTGDQRLILTMEPGEKTASYRRYFIAGLPRNCCGITGAANNTAQVTALAKLDFIPVAVDTDYLTPIQNLEAIIEECISIRYSTMDSSTAAGLAVKHHKDAIALLNGQITHMEGKDRPAVSFAPFGSARLRRHRIGQLV